LEEALVMWLTQALQENLTINGDIIKQKACAFRDNLGIQNFKASDGWLAKFKKRHHIRSYLKSGEGQSAPIETLDEERIRLQEVINQYDLNDVFNCDETGKEYDACDFDLFILMFACLLALYWQLEPSRTLAMAPVIGVKKSKNRATLLLTCNATGTEKLRPLFIHYFKNPRALKIIDKDKLPVDYYWNKSAWMQISIFNDYLIKLNRKMHQQNRNILLIMDNATTHAITDPEYLTHIKFITYPLIQLHIYSRVMLV
jgi:hypothetical protein